MSLLNETLKSSRSSYEIKLQCHRKEGYIFMPLVIQKKWISQMLAVKHKNTSRLWTLLNSVFDNMLIKTSQVLPINWSLLPEPKLKRESEINIQLYKWLRQQSWRNDKHQLCTHIKYEEDNSICTKMYTKWNHLLVLSEKITTLLLM